MPVSVSPSDLDLLLDLKGTIDENRAELLIGLAEDLCQTIVNPIPDNCRSVVLTVAARAYMNAAGVTAQTVGPETVQYGTSFAGIYLTKVDIATLQRAAGTGGAFTVDPTPADAATELYPWDENFWLLTGGENAYIPEVEPDGSEWE